MTQQPKVVICPYCGETQPADAEQCRSCSGFFDALSRQATHNAMGPWFVHDRNRPHQPGCSYETLAKMVERGQVTKYSVVRGPTTKQYWNAARRVPGVAHLLGYCHACDALVEPSDHGCDECGVPFGAYLDRNWLGVPDVRLLPGEGPSSEDRDVYAEAPVGWSPSGAATGVSSFASDDELMGHAPVATLTPPVPAARPEDPGASGEGLADPAVAITGQTVFNAMQRRLARQSRTIRVLTILVLVVAVASAIINVALASAMRSGAKDDARERPGPTFPAAAGNATDDRSGLPDAGAAPEPLEDVAIDAGADAADLSEPPVVEPSVTAPPVTAPPVTPTAPTPRELAEELLAAAADDARPDDERIRDYEQALEILRNLADTAEGEGVAAIISGAELALERLRLRAFFPGGGG